MLKAGARRITVRYTRLGSRERPALKCNEPDVIPPKETKHLISEQSRRLITGDRVGFRDVRANPPEPPIDFGTVLANNKHAVQIKWDDVENSGCTDGIGWIDHNDAACLTKEA